MVPLVNSDNFRIFCALIRRDIKVFSSELIDTIIDGIVLIFTETLTYGAFLPLMGMPATDIAAMYIGSIVFILFFLGENLSISHVFDLRYERFIDYQLILPISRPWLFAHFVASFVIQTALISSLLLIFGLLLLGNKFAVISPHWLLLIIVYFLSLIFFGLFFLLLSFITHFEWFMDNVWPRILSPLYAFGCTVFIWNKVEELSPAIAKLCLLNPLTYISEGLRAAAIGGQTFISLWICIPVISISIIALSYLLMYGINKTLDPV